MRVRAAVQTAKERTGGYRDAGFGYHCAMEFCRADLQPFSTDVFD
jgi:hypothetical protein